MSNFYDDNLNITLTMSSENNDFSSNLDDQFKLLNNDNKNFKPINEINNNFTNIDFTSIDFTSNILSDNFDNDNMPHFSQRHIINDSNEKILDLKLNNFTGSSID